MKARVPLAPAVAQYPGHRQLRVVVQNALGHAAQRGESRDVAVQERLGGLCRIGLHEAAIAVGQVQHQVVRLPLHPADDHRASPKSHWAWPGAWDKGTNISWVRRRRSLT